MRSNFYIISVLNVGQIVSWTLLILSSSRLYATIDHSRLWPRDSSPSLASSYSHSIVIGLVTYIICHTVTLHQELSRHPCSIRKAFQFTFPNRVQTHVIIMILDMYIIINPGRTDGWSQIYGQKTDRRITIRYARTRHSSLHGLLQSSLAFSVQLLLCFSQAPLVCISQLKCDWRWWWGAG